MKASQNSLIVFADDWGRHPSSCQHLVRRLRTDHNVLWVNTIGTRRLQANSITARRVVEKLKNWGKGLRTIDDRMWVLELAMLPAVGNHFARALNRRLVSWQLKRTMDKLGLSDAVVLTTLPYVLWMINEVPNRGLVYYVTDDYSHWPGADRDSLVRADIEMAQSACLVLAVSRALLTKYERSTRREYFPHGVDWEHFASTQDRRPPAILANLPRPRIGFFGLIYEKLDFELLSAVARHFTNGSVIMIGPEDYCDSKFAAMSNVHRVGKQPYQDLPTWISGLDVLMLPYVNDEMIRQSGPLKLRECLATGKPTVSVDVPDVRSFEHHVRMAVSTTDFISQLECALHENNIDSVRARQEAVRNDGWDQRAEQLNLWIQSLS